MFDPQRGNNWSTIASYAAGQSAAKIVGTFTSKCFLTDVTFYSNTIGALTIFQNTTTTKFIVTPSITGTSQHFSFLTPIEFATNSAIHVTTVPTVSSVFLSGFYL